MNVSKIRCNPPDAIRNVFFENMAEYAARKGIVPGNLTQATRGSEKGDGRRFSRKRLFTEISLARAVHSSVILVTARVGYSSLEGKNESSKHSEATTDPGAISPSS